MAGAPVKRARSRAYVYCVYAKRTLVLCLAARGVDTGKI